MVPSSHSAVVSASLRSDNADGRETVSRFRLRVVLGPVRQSRPPRRRPWSLVKNAAAAKLRAQYYRGQPNRLPRWALAPSDLRQSRLIDRVFDDPSLIHKLISSPTAAPRSPSLSPSPSSSQSGLFPSPILPSGSSSSLSSSSLSLGPEPHEVFSDEPLIAADDATPASPLPVLLTERSFASRRVDRRSSRRKASWAGLILAALAAAAGLSLISGCGPCGGEVALVRRPAYGPVLASPYSPSSSFDVSVAPPVSGGAFLSPRRDIESVPVPEPALAPSSSPSPDPALGPAPAQEEERGPKDDGEGQRNVSRYKPIYQVSGEAPRSKSQVSPRRPAFEGPGPDSILSPGLAPAESGLSTITEGESPRPRWE